MTAADWLIVAVVLLNIILAAMQGFFAEAFSMAGLVVGYVVAAWRYQRLAEWFTSFLKSQLLAEILAFLVIFFCDFVSVQYRRQNRTQIDEGGRIEWFRPVYGRAAGSGKRVPGGGRGADGYDGIHTHFAVARKVRTGAIFSGSGSRCDLGSAFAVAGALL